MLSNSFWFILEGQLKAEWKDLESLSITHDSWTSINTDSYEVTTGHYFNSDWELQSNVIDISKVIGRHRHVNIKDHVSKTLRDNVAQVEYENITATTDNASNEIKAFEEGLRLSRVPCIGHMLHNCVKYGLKTPEIEEQIEKCSKIATLMHKSSSAKQFLEEKQKIVFEGSPKLIGN